MSEEGIVYVQEGVVVGTVLLCSRWPASPGHGSIYLYIFI